MILEGNLGPAAGIIIEAIDNQRCIKCQAAVDRLANIWTLLGVNKIGFAFEFTRDVALSAADRQC